VAYGYHSPDCPVSQRSRAPTVGRAIFARHVDCSNGQLVHQTVSDVPINPEEQRSDMPNLEEIAHRTVNRTCPVRHSTEGRNCLPRLPPTAPSCLGAIKGTPRRMEELSKHSLSILRLPHSVSAHLIDCYSDLSSV
jgi:hypothetical protein